MELFRFNQKCLKSYSIVCEYWETSQAWGHRARLMYNGNEILKTSIRYYNRTWEVYRFQSVMQRLVSLYHDKKMEDCIKAYKELNGISRFKKGEKESVIKQLEKNDSIFKRIKMMKKAINFGNSGDFKRDFN